MSATHGPGTFPTCSTAERSERGEQPIGQKVEPLAHWPTAAVVERTCSSIMHKSSVQPSLSPGMTSVNEALTSTKDVPMPG